MKNIEAARLDRFEEWCDSHEIEIAEVGDIHTSGETLEVAKLVWDAAYDAGYAHGYVMGLPNV